MPGSVTASFDCLLPTKVRQRVQEKREELESRRKMLSAAYEAHSEDIREEAEQKIHVEEAR